MLLHGFIKFVFACLILGSARGARVDNEENQVESYEGVVAADHAQCSTIGGSILRRGGHAVDAAVATALCAGVVSPASSGIGGGAFMVVMSASTSETTAFDMRETAPMAAFENMYEHNIENKYRGPLSTGVPGEISGLHEAWLRYGRLPWKTLFSPAINLAENGFEVSPFLGDVISGSAEAILKDGGLRSVFAPNGKVLRAGEICHNINLAQSLKQIAEEGPQAFYNGTVGKRYVEDVRKAGGILTMEDLRNYKVEVSDAMEVDFMGFTLYGMPPPSSGTLGLSLIGNILENYDDSNALKGDLGFHRMIEAIKHMFAVRMNLGDPKFVNITDSVNDMLSKSYGREIWKKIFDNTTFPSDYYLPRWSQLQDEGTCHVSIVDSERNAVALTTTINYRFGAGLLSPSTGITLNNEMGDFSAPTEISPDLLPPTPANYIKPNKRPLSSMTPIIITKDEQLMGVMGGSGGLLIIPAVLRVLINYFINGLDPLDAVVQPRVYHRLIPNVVLYENLTCANGYHIRLSGSTVKFLEGRGHETRSTPYGAVVQLVVQTPERSNKNLGRKLGSGIEKKGMLTGVSDPRKGGLPAAVPSSQNHHLSAIY